MKKNFGKDKAMQVEGTGKKVMARSPKTERPTLKFVGEVLGSFIIVNGLLVAGAIFLVPTHTMGSNASAHLDPTTGQPAIMQLKGCELVESTPSTAEVSNRSSLRDEANTPGSHGFAEPDRN